MFRNVGDLDRIVRGVAGLWLAAVAVSAALDDKPTTAVTAAIASAGLLFSWRTGLCGCNAVFGIDTTDGDGGDTCPIE